MKRSLSLLVIVCAVALVWWRYADRGSAIDTAVEGEHAASGTIGGERDELALPEDAHADVESPNRARTTVAGRSILAGKVVWGSGGTVAYARVVVRSLRDASFAPELQTDGFGNFRVEVPDRGPYDVTAERRKSGRGGGLPDDGVLCSGLAHDVLAPLNDLRVELVAPFEVRGRVLGPDHEPPTAFFVVARRPTPPGTHGASLREQFIGDDGRFALVLPNGGEWELLAEAACLVESAPRSVAVGGSVRDIELVCGATSAVRGRVLDPDGNPIGDARVVGADQLEKLSLAAMHQDISGDDGSFYLGCLVPGTHRLHAVREGFPPSDEIEVELANGEERDDLVLQLHRGATVEVLVRSVHPSSSRTLELDVRAAGSARVWRIPKREPASDANVARVTATGVLGGSSDVTVTIHDELGMRELHARVELFDGGMQTLALDDSARPRVLVTGRVTMGGVAAAAEPLSFEYDDDATCRVEALTDVDGRFEIQLPYTGAWLGKIGGLRGVSWSPEPGVITDGQVGRAREVYVTLDVPEVDHWTCNLELGGGSLAGHVVGVGAPLEAFSVTLRSVEGARLSVHETVRASVDGAFAFEALPPGEYVLSAAVRQRVGSAAAWVARTLEAVPVRAGERRDDLELVVTRAARVVVQLRGGVARGEEGLVYVLGREGVLASAPLEERDGLEVASLESVPPGEMRVYACRGERYASSDWFTVGPGASKELALDFVECVATVFRVVDPEGGPMGIDFAVLPRGQALHFPVSWGDPIDDETYLAFVPPGEWDAAVELDDGRTLTQAFTVRAGEKSELTVRVQ